MPTGTPDNPFAPGDPIGRELLEAYATGRCTLAQQHVVEHAMEADPLLRDAVDGLRVPGAVDALHSMRRPISATPTTGQWRRGFLAFAGVVLLAGTWLVVSPMMDRPAPITLDRPLRMPERPPVFVDTLPPMEIAEIMEAVEQPAVGRIGHATNERHNEAMQHVVERTMIDRLEARPVDTTAPVRTERRPVTASKPSRQLVFLHGYKLVHPNELYAFGPMLHEWQGHTPAEHADTEAKNAAAGRVRTVSYLSFMDAAMAKFKAHDHKGALMELRFVMDQYPDDVNALFYAGLCAYNIGAYERAENFLTRSATHRIDTFDEEAQWYHALTLEQLGDHAAAQRAFARIAAQGGFYAGRATMR